MAALALSTSQAADVLGVSRHTVGRMVRDGRLPKLPTGTKTVQIPRWAIEEMLGRELPEGPSVRCISISTISGGTFT